MYSPPGSPLSTLLILHPRLTLCAICFLKREKPRSNPPFVILPCPRRLSTWFAQHPMSIALARKHAPLDFLWIDKHGKRVQEFSISYEGPSSKKICPICGGWNATCGAEVEKESSSETKALWPCKRWTRHNLVAIPLSKNSTDKRFSMGRSGAFLKRSRNHRLMRRSQFLKPSPSIISSSLSDGHRPGMQSQSRSNGQLGCEGIGAKSLDRDLVDVHTWHSQTPDHRSRIRTCTACTSAALSTHTF